MNTKNSFIDFLKGVAILLVLIGLCIQYGSGAIFLKEELYWENIVMKIIYSFHMPLFIAVSGYLFWKSVKRHGLIKSIKSRIKKLMPVCFTWAVILSAIDLAKGEFVGIKSVFYHFLTDFWFLWAIIFCVCCVTLIECMKKIGGAFACAIILLGFIITPDTLWSHAYKYVAPYFIAGYYYAKRENNWLESNKAGIVATILWSILMRWYSKDSYIYTTGVTILKKESVLKQLVIDGYRYLVGAMGVIAIIWAIKKGYKMISLHESLGGCFMKELIEYLGMNSITFYILSTYLFAWILPALTKDFTFNFIVTLLETVAVALLCDAGGRLIKRSKAVSRWLIAS